jgi:hypothetical protein
MNDPGGGRRSEWGKNLYDLRPLYAERMQLRRVGPVPEPAEPKGFTEYLFDERRRLVETRAHRGAGRVDVERYRHGDDGIDVEHIAATPGVPVTHSRYEVAGGHVVAWRWQTLAGLAEETYTYEDERVTDIRTSGPNDPPRLFRCDWGPTGLTRITVTNEATGRVAEVFRAILPSTPDEVSALEELLFRTIVDHVRAFPVKSPAYALLLVENDGYDAVPPELAVGLAREREGWSAAGPRERERAWSPEDLALFDLPPSHLDEAAVQAAARAFRDGLRLSGQPEEAHRLNLRVAKRLNDESDRLDLPKTHDFVVVVVSLEGGFARSELDSYVPPAKLAALRSAGWL